MRVHCVLFAALMVSALAFPAVAATHATNLGRERVAATTAAGATTAASTQAAMVTMTSIGIPAAPSALGDRPADGTFVPASYINTTTIVGMRGAISSAATDATTT